MKNHDLIEALAGLLDIDTQEAGSLLKGFFSAMVTELLAAQKLSIKGLGSFTVTSIPLKKKSNTSGITYTPPCNKLTFDSRISGTDDSVRIATLRLLMNPVVAERLAQSLAVVFANAVKQQKEIQINGLGLFSLEQGLYRFIPECSLEELLNREYKNLEEVVLPHHDTSPVRKESKKLRYALPFSVFIFACAVLPFLYYWQPEAILSSSTAKPAENKVTIAVQRETIPVKKLPTVAMNSQELSTGGVADSVVLEKGDYIIVLETFRLERTALKEQARLHSKGLMAYVWPGSVNGVQYYRIVTGKFLNRNEALTYIKSMPEKIAGSIYIQQVIKKGILHGEKGL
ncbi:MAG: HU family DNA-binding protein [Chlorobiales bacterium]|nr:HU family DNA-binding protein [Chlorobiales bacterium]